MNNIYVTGDKHARPADTLNKYFHPVLDTLDSKDYLIICGDFGVPFGIAHPEHSYIEEIDQATKLQNQPWTTIVCAGNHDDYDAIEQMPYTPLEVGGYHTLKLCDATFDKILIFDKPSIMDIAGCRTLIIPGADSHDIQGGIADPDSPTFEQDIYEKCASGRHFRIKHWSWWPQEKIDTSLLLDILTKDPYQKFDLIISHEVPVYIFSILQSWHHYSEPNMGQIFLDYVYNYYAKDAMWYAGHYHMNCHPTNRFAILYDEVEKFTPKNKNTLDKTTDYMV